MKPAIAFTGFALFGALSAAGVARAQNRGPSVLVQLTALHRGSLPRTVTLYGRAETDPAARQTLTAPGGAVVGSVFVRPGQAVAAGAPLVRLKPTPATAAAYAQAVSAARVADDLIGRTRALLAQRLATAQELAAAEKSRADARVALAALVAEGAGGAHILQAPFAAIVTAVAAHPGASVAQGASLVEIARLDALVLLTGAVPRQAAAIRPGASAAITPLGERDSDRGTVTLRGSMVDPQTGLVPVIVAPEKSTLLPGETAEVRIVTGEIRGYVVPHAAILVDDRGAAYVVQAEGRIARKVGVQILGHERDRDVVAGPLDPGAALVLAGNYQLEDGMQIRVADHGRAAGR